MKNHRIKMFLLSGATALLLSLLAFFPQATEDSEALDLSIQIQSGSAFFFDDTYPPLTAEVRYNITQSASVVGTLYMPFNDDGITWTNETFITRSGTGVSASGGNLTGAGFGLSFGSANGTTGTMTLIYEDASDVVLQTTTIDFEIARTEITSTQVNGSTFTEGQAFAIEQGGELTVTVEGTSNFSNSTVEVGNQLDFQLSTMDVLFESGINNGVSELGPIMYVNDPTNSQTFGPFTARITNTGSIDPGTYPIYIRKGDDEGYVPGSTFFNLTINEPASFCGDTTVDEPNDDAIYEQCDNGGLCDDNTTVCNAHADCAGIGSELCVPQDGDGCDSSCQSEYYSNVTLSSQYCAPGGTIDLSYDVSLPAAADVLALSIDDANGFAPLSDEVEFSALGVNNTGTFTPAFPAFFSLPSNSGTFDASGVTSVQATINCATLSGPWYIALSAIDNDLSQSIVPSMRTLPFEVTNSAPVCGNALVEGVESCDDGNTINGDGCSDTCQTEVISAPTGGGSYSRGRIGARATYSSDDQPGPDVTLGTNVFAEESSEGDDVLDFSSLDIGFEPLPDFSATHSAYLWIAGVSAMNEPVNDALQERESPYTTPQFQGFQATPTYGAATDDSSFRNDLFEDDPLSYEEFDTTMTTLESIDLTLELPIASVNGLYSQIKYLDTSLEMVSIMPEIGEGWGSVVIADERDRLDALSDDLINRFDLEKDSHARSSLPNTVDCPSCAPYFAMALTLYRHYVLPLEYLYSDLLCDAAVSSSKKRAAERLLIQNIEQLHDVVEHYLEAYQTCRDSTDEELCPEVIDLESFSPTASEDVCEEDPVFSSKHYSLDSLGSLDETLSDKLKEYRRAGNRLYPIEATLSF